MWGERGAGYINWLHENAFAGEEEEEGGKTDMCLHCVHWSREAN